MGSSEFNPYRDPLKLVQLVGCDWLLPGSLIYLRDDLPFKIVGRNRVYRNCRFVLEDLENRGAYSLTPRRFLKRSVVSHVLDHCDWPAGYVETIQQQNKVINEIDAWWIHCLRILLETAGLVEVIDQKLQIVPARSYLCEKDQAGKLYRLLFSTTFKKINLGYISGRGGEIPKNQFNIPYMLLKLHELNDRWVSLKTFYERLVISGAEDELYLMDVDEGDRERALYYLVLVYLVCFGLLEERYEQAEPVNEFFTLPAEMRTTGLFNRFVEINEFSV